MIVFIAVMFYFCIVSLNKFRSVQLLKVLYFSIILIIQKHIEQQKSIIKHKKKFTKFLEAKKKIFTWSTEVVKQIITKIVATIIPLAKPKCDDVIIISIRITITIAKIKRRVTKPSHTN